MSIILLVILTIYSLCATITPTASAKETSVAETTLTVLSDVAKIDNEHYSINQRSLDDTEYFGVPQKNVEFFYASPDSSFRASCTYVSNQLQELYLSEYDGNISLKQKESNQLDVAKGFLTRFEATTKDSFYGKLAESLNTVTLNQNITKTIGNLKLEISANQKNDHYRWTYVDSNGVTADRKNIVLNYEDGQLKSFINNWPLFDVIGQPKLSKEQAIELAIAASKIFSYNVTNQNGTIETISGGFSIANESFVISSLCYLNYDNQNDARGGNSFDLYPAWSITLGFDRFYPGDVSGLVVLIWADTGEVTAMHEIVTDSGLADASNVTSTSQANSQMSNQSLSIAVPATFCATGLLFGLIGIKKKAFAPKKRSNPKLTPFLVIWIALIGLSLVIPQVGAVTPPFGMSRIYSYENPSTSYGFHNETANLAEGTATAEICEYAALNFSNNGYATSNMHGSGTTQYTVTHYLSIDEQNYDRTAVLYVGHFRYRGYAFQDNYANDIYDTSIYPETSAGNHFFTFLWVCNQAENRDYNGYVWPYYIHWSEPNFVVTEHRGMPIAWTHRDGVGNTLMRFDGYSSPDGSGQCYISFNGMSPMLSGIPTNTFQETNGTNCKEFIKRFYYYALIEGWSVKDSLNRASQWYFNGKDYDECILYEGYQSYWPGGDFDGLPYPQNLLSESGYYPVDFPEQQDPYGANWMRVHGDSNVKLYQPLVHLSAVCDDHNQEALQPTFYLNGAATWGSGRVIPKTYSVSVSSLPNYEFDHFTLNGQNCGSNIPLYDDDDEVVAHYTWDPVYYNLAISSSGYGYTSPSGTQSCLSYTTQTVTAYPNEGYIHYWILDDDEDNPDFSPTIEVLMDGDPPTHSLDAYFVERPDYNFVSYANPAEGTAYDEGRLAGVDNDGRYATIEGWGPYELYGSITSHMYFTEGGHIYVYGYASGYGSLYVYASEDGSDWNLVSTPIVPNTLGWVDCGIYDRPFNYIKFSAEDPNNAYTVYIDSVCVEPVFYHTLSISTDGEGYTTPSGTPQYEGGTYAAVTAHPAPTWLFDYWTLDGDYAGSNPTINVYMDQYRELEAHFSEDSNLQWLTVNAYDDYLGEYYPYEPNVWVDGYWVDTGPVSLQVAASRDHSVTVDWSLYSPYWCQDVYLIDYSGDYYGYVWDNTVYFTPTYDTTINALYLPYWGFRTDNGTDTESLLALTTYSGGAR